MRPASSRRSTAWLLVATTLAAAGLAGAGGHCHPARDGGHRPLPAHPCTGSTGEHHAHPAEATPDVACLACSLGPSPVAVQTAPSLATADAASPLRPAVRHLALRQAPPRDTRPRAPPVRTA